MGELRYSRKVGFRYSKISHAGHLSQQSLIRRDHTDLAYPTRPEIPAKAPHNLTIQHITNTSRTLLSGTVFAPPSSSLSLSAITFAPASNRNRLTTGSSPTTPPSSLSTAQTIPCPSTHSTAPLPYPFPFHTQNFLPPPALALNSTSLTHSSLEWYPYFWMRASCAGSSASNCSLRTW